MTFNPAEKHQSQIPAVQLLVALGFQPLSQAELRHQRGDRLRNVLLEEILVEQLRRINRFAYRGEEYPFDLEDIHEAIRRLKPMPDQLKGLRGTNQDIYDALLLGTTIAKTIQGDSRSWFFRYIDWETPRNNVFHVASEVVVQRAATEQTRRCDIVGYVNGIPFLVIENKRPTESLRKAGSQLIGYQNEDQIPHLFHFAQLLMVMNRHEARYATVGTPWKFWQGWSEDQDVAASLAEIAAAQASVERYPIVPETDAGQPHSPAALYKLVNQPLKVAEKQAVYSGSLSDARPYFDVLAADGSREITGQDKALHALARPERLLDLVRRFTVFDAGKRKIARHQQFFGVLAVMRRVKQFDMEGRRKGGVVWHTQGSGKSLTMVMLGRALALSPDIRNPRIVIVTDRVDLDKHIKDAFKSCDMEPVRATSGTNLLELIRARKPLITTIVNKFYAAANKADYADDDANIFVLVDESHRSQTGRYGGHGKLAVRMRRILPKACYIGFTGTPLLKREKNTFETFGGLIHQYAIDEAIEDEAVVPLLYEGRLVEQKIAGDAIDRWFDKISEGLTDAQKADLKRKFSRMDALSKTEQAIRAKAFDISEHFRQHWQGTGFKAQLAAPSKAAAVRFKEALDEIGHVSSEIIISPPDDSEGNEEVDGDSRNIARRFWERMMARFKTEEAYNQEIIDAFRNASEPEILIVVSKLLTGFDAPRNTVLYVCKPLREHNLLQAIARVNRLCEEEGPEGRRMEKRFGFIIDYEGLLGDLDAALTAYSAFEGYDPEDLVGAVRDVREEIRKLAQLREQLWDVFKTVANKKDMEQFEQFLSDEAVRQDFYERLRAFSRCLHIALSSDKLYDAFSDAKIACLKKDWKQFSELRRSVRLRYQEVVDVREFESKIRRLLDDHVTALPAETIIPLVNINDPKALNAVLSETGISEASKADRIASATRRAITESMEKDPAFYERFSKLLEETMRDYRQRRISESRYLSNVVDVARKVAAKDRGRDMPESLRGDDDALAFFGVLRDKLLQENKEGLDRDLIAEVASALVEIVKQRHIVDVWSNEEAQNAMRNAIDDYFFDVLRDGKGIYLPTEVLDELQQKIMRVARARFPA